MILRYNKFLENKDITKSELVEKIKYYSSYIEGYMNDYNKYTTSNLNLGFSYYKLRIDEIFKITSELNSESSDGLIRAICNEFIQWGKYFTSSCSPGNSYYKRRYNKDFIFDYDYANYTEDYKIENKKNLYDQLILHNIYYYVGYKIEELIKGTTWEIPEITEFTNDDSELVMNCLVNEYDFNESDVSVIFNDRSKELKLTGLDNSLIENDTDFVERLQYYFGGLIVLKNWNGTKLYLPFKE